MLPSLAVVLIVCIFLLSFVICAKVKFSQRVIIEKPKVTPVTIAKSMEQCVQDKHPMKYGSNKCSCWVTCLTCRHHLTIRKVSDLKAVPDGLHEKLCVLAVKSKLLPV